MKRLLSLALLAAPAAAQAPPTPLTPTSIVAAAPTAEWKAIDPADLLVMTLAPDAAGQPRTVTIQLIPPPFSRGWTGNIRRLAKAHWWDGTSVYRVVDNWVTQWGDGEDNPAKAKPLPAGLKVVPESEYAIAAIATEPNFDDWTDGDPVIDDNYAIGRFWHGWPLGRTYPGGPGTVVQNWPIHCYGTVGVARDLDSTGTGAELYAVIGQAPRQLDRNIAVVGRVIEGIENLSTLPRGKGAAGVYDDPRLRVPILSVRLGNELPEPPRFEYLDTAGATFARYVNVSANRHDPFYKVPAGGIDICNAKVPIRRVPQ
ncbi:MAG: peptidylprolyl isomerase [Croceibacterium sp.]